MDYEGVGLWTLDYLYIVDYNDVGMTYYLNLTRHYAAWI
jgi:hypothetical protein